MKRLSPHPFTLHHQFLPYNKLSKNQLIDSKNFLFIFHNGLLLLEKQNTELTIPHCGLENLIEQKYSFSRQMGVYNGIQCQCVEVEVDDLPSQHHVWMSLREAYSHLEHDLYILAGKAVQVLHWHNENRFCGQCGAPMVDHQTELAKLCPKCSFVAYPRLSPVVIMTVEHEDQILLGRSPHFPKGMYSPLAGFVDIGETLEEAVAREILEESGLKIDNIRYVTSQSWPFPHSMMLGFRSDYVSGEIVIEEEELEDVQWFTKDNLPTLPSQISISRYLMECFIAS